MTPPLPTAQDLRDNAAFEALMWALARPGTVHDLAGGLESLIGALIDRECRVMTDDPALAHSIAATGAAQVAAGMADHAFCLTPAAALAALAALPAGSALYPDAGATLVLAARLAPSDAGIGAGTGAEGAGPVQRLALSGPGLEHPASIEVAGLPEGFVALRNARCAYPEGVEIVLVDGARLMAWPRSCRVEVL